MGWNGLLLLLERRRPFDPDWNPPAGEARTDGAFLLTSAVAAPALARPSGATANGNVSWDGENGADPGRTSVFRILRGR